MEDVTQKQCYYCHTFKPFLNFNKCKTGVYGYHNHCRECQKIVRRNWYLKNREQELVKSAEYAKSDEGKLGRQKFWTKHKNILGPKQNERRRLEPAKIKARIQRGKWLSIPHNKIAQTNRGRIRDALRGIAKTASTEQLIGCSFEELKSHLESKFQEGMTWDNYGDWQIDHIKPCASFDLTDSNQQKICFHYSNLQPLWKKENQSKGGRIGGLLS